MARTFRILLIEGHLPDALLIERALAPADDLSLRTVFSESAARQVLLRRPPFEATRRPDLILLDCDLPVNEQHSLLLMIRRHPTLRRVPLILLRSADQALLTLPISYTLYSTGVLPKPQGVDTAQQFVQALRRAWMPPAHDSIHPHAIEA